MASDTKQKAIVAMVLICNAQKNYLLGFHEAEAMYNAVVHHRRWYRRAARIFGFEI